MAVTYQYIDPPRTPEKSVDFMQNTFVPLLREYWDTRGKQIYNVDMQFNLLTFIQMWTMGSLVIIIAYDDNKPVGFFLGVRFVPILFDAAAVQTELYYGKTKEIEEGLFDYLMKIVGFMNINEIWLDSDGSRQINIPWTKRNSYTVTRYTKE